MAPAKALAGSSLLWFGPATNLAACGVTRPTKPMLPPIDTHMPISTDTHMSTVSFVLFTLTPTLRALSSPMANALSSLVCAKSTPPNTAKAANSTSALRYVEPLRLPIVQKVI